MWEESVKKILFASFLRTGSIKGVARVRKKKLPRIRARRERLGKASLGDQVETEDQSR